MWELQRNLFTICGIQYFYKNSVQETGRALRGGGGDYQAEFRPGRLTIDQIMEKYYEFKKDNWHLFVDFRQAYDSIHRRSMWRILKDFNMPAKLI